MISLKRIISVSLCILFIKTVTAQEGAPLLSNYKESREIENQNWAICQDDNDVMLFANRRGILTFDGQRWNFIRIPTIPYSIKYNPIEKRVYVGGENNYGFLNRDEKGFYKYYSLSGDSSGVGFISRILYTDSTVYFYGEQSISRHNIKTNNLELRLLQKDNKPFTGMFITPRNTFINVFSKGLYRLESDTLFPIVTGYMLENDEVLFSLPYDNNLVLLGLTNGSLSLFDGIKFYDYQIKDDGYLRQNILSEGLSISDSLYAFSTLDGGVLVIEKKSGKLVHAINYQNGLPDDEVFALGADNSRGLWISHQYGLTRADLQLPVGNFSIYPGLKGNLISSIWHNNELFVATSEGVFYLSEVKNYAEVEVLIRNDKAGEGTSVADKETPPVQQQPKKTRKSIFSRIFGKKTVTPVIKEQSNQETSPQLASQITDINKPEAQYIKKTISRLKSINYVFKKVEGMNEKCKQMVSTGIGILASTNKGLFNISGHAARPVVSDRYINYISAKGKDDKYFIATSDGYFYVKLSDGGWSAVYPDNSFMQPVYSITQVDENTVWAGSDDKAFKIILNSGISSVNYETYTIKNNFPQRYIIEYVNDTVFIFSETGVSYYNSSSNSVNEYRKDLTSNGSRIKYVFSQPDLPWIKKGDEWININTSGWIENNDKALLKIFDDIISIYSDKDNIWVVNGDNQLFRIVRNGITSIKPDLDLFIRSISNEEGLYFKFSDIVFRPGDNIVYFDIVAPGYLKQNSSQYQYFVEKMMSDWSKWSSSPTISLMPSPGTYTLRVRAKDIWGNISEPKLLDFTIKAPFTQTTFFYIIASLSLLIIIILIVRFRERQLQKEKRILEEKVKERTAEIEAQKEEITSSIEYASRIQMAMLPMDEIFKTAFADHFVFFKPRDIVSGDFYWISEDANHIFFTVADCTGHGVPGAFMSTLGISTLNEIITNKSDLKANNVLNLLREKIKTSLHQTGKEGEAADGMDVAFCVLHKNRKTLEFAGAYNPLLLFQSGEIKEYKADRMPIGIYVGERESFTNYEINVKKGDIIYLFSDGFTDQFGGPESSKYKKSNLKRLLSEIYYKPMEEQKQILEIEFEKWKGNSDQLDDITIIGVRI